MEDSNPLLPMVDVPGVNTPLYHHPLPCLEAWLSTMGAQQQRGNRCIWDLHCPQWSAEIELEVDELKVSWHQEGQVWVRHFPYGLSRQDAERAIFAGP